MSDHQWENMSDKDFEAMLENTVSQLPPDDIVAEVTPWKKSINRVLVGMALNTITFNFLCLNYILPAIGTILLLLGFRTLRRENRWFGACFVLAIIRAAHLFPSLILNTTIIQSTVNASSLSSALTAANLLILFIEYICLWRGFIAAQRKAGVPPHAGGVAALLVWYAIMCLLALIQYSGLIIAGIMIVGYIFIIRSLYKLSKELDEAGYAITTAPVKITDRCIVISLAAFLLVGCVCGYVFGGSYPMEWSALDPDEHGEVEDIKAHLIDLGFPEYVLNDLSAEDIAACDGALRVFVNVTDEPVNNGRVVTQETEVGGIKHLVQDTVIDVKELRITGIGVQVPGDRERWIIFHHFLWTTDPGFYGTESIQLWPVYRDISEGWHSAGDVTGRVLYDDGGETFVADYYSLGARNFTSDTIFWGEQSRTDVFAEFSMPHNGQNHRGYVAYSVDEVEDGYMIISWFNYTHQRSWLQYPAMTATEKRMANTFDDEPFKTIQNDLHFYPTDEGIEESIS